MPVHHTRRVAAALLLTATLTACGSSEETLQEGDARSVNMSEMDEMSGMDMSMMNEPDATPADQLDGVDPLSADFAPLEGAPQTYDNVAGTAYLARRDDGTTVTIRVEGWPAGQQLISHVHVAGCDQAGGDHFQFDPDGGVLPPNEIHLGGTAGEDGELDLTVTNDRIVGQDARAVVLHSGDMTKHACAEF